MTAPVVDLSRPNRQSVWAVVFLALRTLRGIGVVQLLLAAGFLIARTPSITALFGVVALIGLALLAIAALQWWRYTFEVVDSDLVVKRGVVSQQTLTVPLDRVQSVSIEQKLLHRIVSVVQMSIDTAGTDAAEFTIDAVEQNVATALQRVSTDHRVAHGVGRAAGELGPDGGELGVAMPPPPERTVLSHSPWRVVQIALTQMPFAGLVVLGPLVAVGDDLAEFLPFELPEVEVSGGRWLLWLIPLVLLVVLVFSLVVNLIRVLLADWNLTLLSTASGLRRNAGLLSTTSVAASVPRIQRVGVRQGVLERRVGLHTVHLQTIGNVRMPVPGCDAQQVEEVRAIALARSAGARPLDRLVSPQEVFLRTRNATVAAALIAAGLFWPVGWWSILVFVPIPMVWLVARRQVRLRRWGVNDEAIGDRHELFGWHGQEILLRKINGVTVAQSLFERKRSLATITASTAGGSLSIGMIPIDQARELRDHLLFAVETDRRPWM